MLAGCPSSAVTVASLLLESELSVATTCLWIASAPRSVRPALSAAISGGEIGDRSDMHLEGAVSVRVRCLESALGVRR